MSGAIPPLPNTPSWRGTHLKKHRDNFTFTFNRRSHCAKSVKGMMSFRTAEIVRLNTIDSLEE
jgi:hypothetical protein